MGTHTLITLREALIFPEKMYVVSTHFSNEYPQCGTSNEYPQCKFLRRNKKKIFIWIPLISGAVHCVVYALGILMPPKKKICLGPVFQSIVSLTSLVVAKMLTVLVRRISNSQVFLLKKCE